MFFILSTLIEDDTQIDSKVSFQLQNLYLYSSSFHKLHRKSQYPIYLIPAICRCIETIFTQFTDCTELKRKHATDITIFYLSFSQNKVNEVCIQI